MPETIVCPDRRPEFFGNNRRHQGNVSGNQQSATALAGAEAGVRRDYSPWRFKGPLRIPSIGANIAIISRAADD